MATLTKSTGTVTLSGAVEKVTFPASYGWVWVKNMSDSDMFVGLSDGISARADGVLSIPAGECGRVQTDGQDSVYLIGTGDALVIAQNYAECPFKIAAKGGEIPVVYGENLLINPDFKINQRGITGTFSETGKYFVDRWQLVSGTVTINNDGSITLNGTISQKFENPIDTNTIFSCSNKSDNILIGTGVTEKGIIEISIVASGENFSWVKLEYGKTATPFVPPDPATELLKCQRYYQVVDLGQPIFAMGSGASIIRFGVTLPTAMRANPTAEFKPILGNYTWSIQFVNLNTGVNIKVTDVPTMSGVVVRTLNYLNIKLTVNSTDIVTNMGYLMHGAGGFQINLDAEIY